MKEKTTKESDCPLVLTFQQLVQQIKQLDVVLNREEIENLLTSVTCELTDYQEFIGYAEPYHRKSVVKSESGFAELLVMTWHTNQQSPIHDHYESSCGIRVLQGKMTETLYELVNENRVRQTTTQEWSAGEITSAEASFDIHKISTQSEEGLVTLHIYSAPLDPTKMRRFVEIE